MESTLFYPDVFTSAKNFCLCVFALDGGEKYKFR